MPLNHRPWIWNVNSFWSFVNEKTVAQKGGIADPKVPQLQATEQGLEWSLNLCALTSIPSILMGMALLPEGPKLVLREGKLLLFHA